MPVQMFTYIHKSHKEEYCTVAICTLWYMYTEWYIGKKYCDMTIIWYNIYILSTTKIVGRSYVVAGGVMSAPI